MNNNIIEKHIIDLIKGASNTAFNGYRSSDIINSVNGLDHLILDAGRTSNYVVDSSSCASQAKQELKNLIDLHNDELIRLINLMNQLNMDLAEILERKFEKISILEEKNLTHAIREIDQYVGTEWYKNEGSKKVMPLRNVLDTRDSKTEINVTDVQIKKVDSSSFKNTFNELNKVTSYSNSSYRFSNRSRYSRDKNQISLDMRRANEDSRSAMRHADFALASFKRENQVLNDSITKCNAVIKELRKNIKYETRSLARIEKIIRYTECKIEVLNINREINTRKIELAKICETAGTPLYNEQAKTRAKILRKEIENLEKQKH